MWLCVLVPSHRHLYLPPAHTTACEDMCQKSVLIEYLTKMYGDVMTTYMCVCGGGGGTES